MRSAAAALAMTANATQSPIRDHTPLTYLPIIDFRLETRAMRKMRGTATIPLNTAVRTSALIGSTDERPKDDDEVESARLFKFPE